MFTFLISGYDSYWLIYGSDYCFPNLLCVEQNLRMDYRNLFATHSVLTAIYGAFEMMLIPASVGQRLSGLGIKRLVSGTFV